MTRFKLPSKFRISPHQGSLLIEGLYGDNWRIYPGEVSHRGLQYRLEAEGNCAVPNQKQGEDYSKQPHTVSTIMLALHPKGTDHDNKTDTLEAWALETFNVPCGGNPKGALGYTSKATYVKQ